MAVARDHRAEGWRACNLCGRSDGALKLVRNGACVMNAEDHLDAMDCRNIRMVHVSCAYWLTGRALQLPPSPVLIDGLAAIPPERFGRKCIVCRKRGVGACLQCAAPDCDVSYHVTCAMEWGMRMEDDKSGASRRRTFCPRHSRGADAADAPPLRLSLRGLPAMPWSSTTAAGAGSNGRLDHDGEQDTVVHGASAKVRHVIGAAAASAAPQRRPRGRPPRSAVAATEGQAARPGNMTTFHRIPRVGVSSAGPPDASGPPEEPATVATSLAATVAHLHDIRSDLEMVRTLAEWACRREMMKRGYTEILFKCLKRAEVDAVADDESVSRQIPDGKRVRRTETSATGHSRTLRRCRLTVDGRSDLSSSAVESSASSSNIDSDTRSLRRRHAAEEMSPDARAAGRSRARTGPHHSASSPAQPVANTPRSGRRGRPRRRSLSASSPPSSPSTTSITSAECASPPPSPPPPPPLSSPSSSRFTGFVGSALRAAGAAFRFRRDMYPGDSDQRGE
ncbi:hypothetical protein CDCA_CDCA06G1924 [Cyanidium caldarium]|uniref:PHD-type domain-containing protein n=1 Tax=Cyanidium caldarium TaxID=2771 RepID=A0AAV9IUH8_CYACA|nr:hypothetical protein CDCA_CDCA06G1924 [Cyanidium caldarium]